MFTCFAATSGDTPFEQAPVTENLVWSICSEVGREWRRLGAALRLESAFLDNIDFDFKESPEKARKVLQKWRQKKEKKQQWESLQMLLKRWKGKTSSINCMVRNLLL